MAYWNRVEDSEDIGRGVSFVFLRNRGGVWFMFGKETRRHDGVGLTNSYPCGSQEV